MSPLRLLDAIKSGEDSWVVEIAENGTQAVWWYSSTGDLTYVDLPTWMVYLYE